MVLVIFTLVIIFHGRWQHEPCFIHDLIRRHAIAVYLPLFGFIKMYQLMIWANRRPQAGFWHPHFIGIRTIFTRAITALAAHAYFYHSVAGHSKPIGVYRQLSEDLEHGR